MTTSTFDMNLVPTPYNIELIRSKLDNLSRHPEFQDKHQHRLRACELAFFAYDTSLYKGPKAWDALHAACSEFREAIPDLQERSVIELRVRRAIFDHILNTLFPQAALLDQLTGSTTLVASMPGAAEPGTPASMEYVKAHAYFPGSIVNELEQEDKSDTISDLMQVIIQELGVPTLRRYERAMSKNWKGLRKITEPPRPLPEIRGIPESIPYNSSRYTFYGRRMDRRSDELQKYGMEDGEGGRKSIPCDATLRDGASEVSGWNLDCYVALFWVPPGSPASHALAFQVVSSELAVRYAWRKPEIS
ncbi:hypothetical protein NMY22_g900 [Coprinellus aureogranulatus]|nr:hypothetical protein NMY22_g900 [Coprinellus aureogranulatus]